jgi:dihydroflavonol-4-reductase
MPVLVTGAAGHLGANLVRALLAQGRSVRALVYRDRRALEGLDLEYFQGDVGSAESMAEACAGCDVVYHLAVHISLRDENWPRMLAINVDGTRNVVNACIEQGVKRLVHFSSVHALKNEPLDRPIDETRALVGKGDALPYDLSKAMSELEVQKGIERGLDAIIINPTGIIGPHDPKPSHFGAVLLALARRQLPALIAGGFDWVDARDVCQGALRAETVAPRGSKYLLSGHWICIEDIATHVEDICGVRRPKFVAPMWLARLGIPFSPIIFQLGADRSLYSSASLQVLRANPDVSHAKATKELGYRPRPIRETLADTLLWFQENGYLERATSPKPSERA